MVAVALLPPTVTAGLVLSIENFKSAYGAVLLLSVTILSVNLSALVVFLAKGLSLRLWLKPKMAKPYMFCGIFIGAAILAGLFVRVIQITI
ncbi:MAG: DUF389 domain-containing protein [Kordiimonadaceae bacterium]|nr:DUF389 domain-containing protein [Kordiimonadaceae bacterium]